VSGTVLGRRWRTPSSDSLALSRGGGAGSQRDGAAEIDAKIIGSAPHGIPPACNIFPSLVAWIDPSPFCSGTRNLDFARVTNSTSSNPFLAKAFAGRFITLKAKTFPKSGSSPPSIAVSKVGIVTSDDWHASPLKGFTTFFLLAIRKEGATPLRGCPGCPYTRCGRSDRV
jgi:hypothetical protein